MNPRRVRSKLAIALALLASAPSLGLAQTSSDPMFYFLTPLSAFETGCFGPCECPVFMRGLQGTFVLQYLGSDPLFSNYAVRDVRWSVPDATASGTVLTGSGTYKVGGEFAVQQQMILDLSVGGKAPQRFDSGLVLGGGEFPHIKIDISLHQNTACIDTVLHVDAKDPVVSTVDSGSESSATFLAEAAPNPFRDETKIQLHLGRIEPLEVRIFDVRGRVVRHLARRAEATPGDYLLAWDGRADQGRLCAAGVYFVGLYAGTEKVVHRIVKLQ